VDTARLWKTILDQLELQVTKGTFVTFFLPTKIVGLENNVATVGCNSAVAVMLMETRYYALIKSHMDKLTGQNTSLLFKIVSTKSTPPASMGPLFNSAPVTPNRAVAAHLRPDFIFDTYAVSGTNHMAYAAATAVASSPGTNYNPLFFYGGVGVGKTHLMQAIGNEVLVKKPNTKVIYCMGEEFTNDIIDAIQTKTTKKFKDKYRSAQILLIDDVQFLEGKIRVQEEFFHTFNAVQREGGQIVLTSDRPPHEIDRLEERLKSRFEGGLLVDMQKPDFELRCAILRIKAQQKGVDLSMPITQILAATSDSVRRLEGVLTKLLTEVKIKSLPLTEDLARAVAGQPAANGQSSQATSVSPKDVTEIVIRRFNLSLSQIKSAKRNRPLARPRQVLMYLLRTQLELPLEEVGTWVGGRDHTTVLHAVDTITHLLSTNAQLREDVEWIKKEAFG